MKDSQGKQEDVATLISRNYAAICRMAAARIRTSGVRLDATSLANDTVCKLLKSGSAPESEAHLQAMAWKSMEWIIVDRARSDQARKAREQSHHVPKQEDRVPTEGADAGLAELTTHYPRQAEVLILSLIAELTFEEIARVLQISVRTVQRDHEFASAFISSHSRLAGGQT